MNTRLTYMYRDASNYKFYGGAVFEGEITAEERIEFTAALHGEENFIAEQVGLESVRPGGTYPDDGVWHEFLEWEVVTQLATEGSVHEFVALCVATKWDEGLAEADLLAPYLERMNVAGIVTIGKVTLYEKCAHCDLFIEVNDDADEFVAAYVHLMNDSRPGDVETDESHEASPSGQLATLSVWEAYGPDGMRARFDKKDQ
jgi:hypothetical protein